MTAATTVVAAINGENFGRDTQGRVSVFAGRRYAADRILEVVHLRSVGGMTRAWLRDDLKRDWVCGNHRWINVCFILLGATKVAQQRIKDVAVGHGKLLAHRYVHSALFRLDDWVLYLVCLKNDPLRGYDNTTTTKRSTVEEN